MASSLAHRSSWDEAEKVFYGVWHDLFELLLFILKFLCCCVVKYILLHVVYRKIPRSSSELFVVSIIIRFKGLWLSFFEASWHSCTELESSRLGELVEVHSKITIQFPLSEWELGGKVIDFNDMKKQLNLLIPIFNSNS